MDPIRTGALVVALPGALAIAAVLAARTWRHGAAIAVAAAAAAGAWAVLGAPELWPLDVSRRFFHVIAAGLIAALAAASPTIAGRAIAAIAGLAAVLLVIGPLLSHRYPGPWSAVAIAAGAGSLAAVWLGLEGAGARGDRAGLLIAAIAAAGAGAGAGLSGSVVIAQLGVAAAAGLGGLWLVSLKRPGSGYLAGAAPLAAVVTWAVVAMAVLYASMTAPVALALLAIPAASAAVRIWSPAHARKAAVACAVVLAAGASAIALAPGGGDQASDSEYDYGYGYE